MEAAAKKTKNKTQQKVFTEKNKALRALGRAGSGSVHHRPELTNAATSETSRPDIGLLTATCCQSAMDFQHRGHSTPPGVRNGSETSQTTHEVRKIVSSAREKEHTRKNVAAAAAEGEEDNATPQNQAANKGLEHCQRSVFM